MSGSPLGLPAAHEEDGAIGIVERGLSGLRIAVSGLLLATLPFSAYVLGFHVRYEIAVPATLLVAAANALVASRAGRGRPPPSPRALAAGLALDLAGIFVVLACSGGAANPWSALFLIHVALAAAVLPLGTTLALSGFAACLFLALFSVPSGACCPSHPENGAFSTHLYGMWFAFAISAGIIATFVTHVRGALAARGREIARLRREAEVNARFRALATLAAGTAHELNTPLGTIAVLAYEINDGCEPEAAKRHGAAIGAQIERCRQVITRLSAGSTRSAEGEHASITDAATRAVAAWRAAHPDANVTISMSCDPAARVGLSASELEGALGALLDNALFACRAGAVTAPIGVHVRREGERILVAVEDEGTGVPADLRERLGEPFLTTKEPGEGMGLGLWLVRRVVEIAGGTLDIGPREPRGTRVEIRLGEARA
ncbi:HAMP domain-containing sensor histidine kinase [Polyangium sp. 6x1]|uniref:sensor histidine kinase n=1 Tax=Polyangium sp. 6x1 TaxID=3042689 RepID=UPI0024829913|nr:HAMP domain-containing sensor histidine kinase [Polyangium sp. 6x1]MDI1443300.1 HAMP domain-containing sensor histidine kinase [Polyangium sp. 6x1]